jgi:hypothetical protein
VHSPIANLIGYTVHNAGLPSLQERKWRCPTKASD